MAFFLEVQKSNAEVKWVGVKPPPEDCLAHLTARANAVHIHQEAGVWVEVDAVGNQSLAHTDPATGDYIPAFRVTHISNETAMGQGTDTHTVHVSVPGVNHVPCRMFSGGWRDIWVTRVYTEATTMTDVVLWA